MGAKKFDTSLETQGIKLFWRDIPGFCRDIPEAPEKSEKKMFGFNFWPLHLHLAHTLLHCFGINFSGVIGNCSWEAVSQAKKKAHKHKLFGPVAPGTTTGLSQGQTDKPGLSLGQTRVFSLFYTVEAQFVPGTNPVCPWDKPVTKGDRKSLCIKRLCAFFAR